MALDRNAIKNSLLALCATAVFASPINGFSTWAQPPSRRLKLWTAVDPSVQPALFLTQHSEDYERKGVGNLVRRWLNVQLWCYAPTGDPISSGIVGDSLLDIMEQALEAVLQPPIGYDELQIDGTYWVRIMKQSGLFIRDPGDIDGQALLVLPVRILLP